MRRFFAGILVLVMCIATPARAGDAEAEAFVTGLAADFAKAGEIARADPAAGRDAVGEVLDAAFDLRSMARAALPEAFRDRSDPAYVAAYRTYLIAEFVGESLNGGEGSTEVLGSRVRSAHLTLVGTRVAAEGRPTRTLEWYLTPTAAGFRVVNVSVEGVLVTAEQARDFNPVLISGDMPGLMQFLTRAADG